MIEKLTNQPNSHLAWLLDYIDERIATTRNGMLLTKSNVLGKIFSESILRKGKLREKLKDPNNIIKGTKCILMIHIQKKLGTDERFF